MSRSLRASKSPVVVPVFRVVPVPVGRPKVPRIVVVPGATAENTRTYFWLTPFRIQILRESSSLNGKYRHGKRGRPSSGLKLELSPSKYDHYCIDPLAFEACVSNGGRLIF